MKKLLKCILGVIICSYSFSTIVCADIGMDAWNALNDGISNISGIKMGYINTIISVSLLFISILMGEKFGVATVLNSVFIGIFMQFFLDNSLVHVAKTLPSGIVQLFLAMILLGFGNFIYMSTGLGAGPRDSFELAICKRINMKFGHMRIITEVIVLFLAFLLGGSLGVGTIISTFGTGYILQFIFDRLNFDPKKVKQQDFFESIKNLK